MDYAQLAASGPAQGANDIVDLRSDTVTKPTSAMLAAMAAAALGDDVYGEDPTANALEERAAEIFGKEAAMFASSGTQSNLCALLAHCARGEEIIVGRDYHVYIDEAHGASVLGGIALDPIPLMPDMGLDPAVIAAEVKPDDPHCPITKLLSLENTVLGKAIPLERQDACIAVARDHGLLVHLDGARVFNAAVTLGTDVATVAAGVDTVSACLSKGLGTPAGTVLCGPKDFIAKARRYRKMLGGGMRQIGLLAAAGLHALEHHVPRLQEDHDRAATLRQALAEIPGLSVDAAPNQTNMALVTLAEGVDGPALVSALAARGIVAGQSNGFMRLVVHQDVSDHGLDRVIDGFAASVKAA